MGSDHEWYRTPDFSPSAMKDFEARLARSRGAGNKSQYLRIKALYIDRKQPGGMQAALDLTRRALEENSGDLHHAMTCVAQMGDLLREAGRRQEALAAYIQSAELMRQVQGRFRDLEIPIAEILLELGSANDVRRAGEWLVRGPPGYVLRDSVYRWNRAKARHAALAGGDPGPFARAALAAADNPSKTFPDHPRLDVVHPSEGERRELGVLAGFQPPRARGFLSFFRRN